MTLPANFAIGIKHEALPDLQAMISRPPVLAIYLGGLLEVLAQTPADREEEANMGHLIGRVRDAFLQRIAPKLKKLGLKLGTIGKVTPVPKSILSAAHHIPTMEQMRWLVQSNLEYIEGTPMIGAVTKIEFGDDKNDESTVCLNHLIGAFTQFHTQLQVNPLFTTAKAQGMDVLCMGEFVYNKALGMVCWQLLPVTAMIHPDDPKATGIDWNAARPRLFPRLPTTAPQPRSRKRQRAEPESSGEPQTKRTKGDS